MALRKLVRQTARWLPDGVRIRLRDALGRSRWGMQLMERAFRDSVDVLIVSFPKAGRTWLRLMLGHLLSAHHEIDAVYDELLNLRGLASRNPGVPLIRVDHEDDPHRKSPADLSTDKTACRGKKVILLFRDIRDILVSLYFENTRRTGKLTQQQAFADLATFVHSEVGSLETIIRYYNIWAENSHIPGDFLLIRYEDMHANAGRELRKVVEFLELDGIEDELIARSVEFARFENMHQMELEGRFGSARMQPGTRGDPESYKTRKGKVGGYVDYMDEELISHVTEQVRSRLSDFYGFR